MSKLILSTFITLFFLPSFTLANGSGVGPGIVMAALERGEMLDALERERDFRDHEFSKLQNWSQLADNFSSDEGIGFKAKAFAENEQNWNLKAYSVNHNYYPSIDGVDYRDIDLSGLMFTREKIPANADMDAILEAVVAIQPMQPMNRDIHAGMKVHTSVRFLGEYDGKFMVETKTGGHQEIFDLSENELEQYPWMYNAALISSQLDGRTVILN